MDTNRIVINNYDLSRSPLPGGPTKVSGFTVIKAKKGPKTPIRFRPGKGIDIKRIFGDVSKEYPEVYEALEFNSAYDTYISAPYTSAKVPVAYVIHKGVFPAAELIDYNDTMESYVAGNILGSMVESTLIPEEISVLIDTRYPGSGLGIRQAKGLQAASDQDDINLSTELIPDVKSTDNIKYSTDKIVIRTGVTPQQLGWGEYPSNKTFTATSYMDKDLKNLRLLNIPTKAGYIDFTIQESSKELHDDKGYKVGDIVCESNTDELTFEIKGHDSSELTTTIVKEKLNAIEALDELKCFWKYPVEASEIYAVIFPKYPTTDTLKLDFTPFNTKAGYGSRSIKSRNRLDFTLSSPGNNYVGALTLFKATINPSDSSLPYAEDLMKLREPDSPLGFYIRKPIEKSDFNLHPWTLDMNRYPGILLMGGEKVFEDDDANIHDLGWALARGEEYSGVDIFFDCEHHYTNKEIPTVDKAFYSLASVHPLSGFIFNCTVPREDLEMSDTLKSLNPLSFGSNYWNICNEAIIKVNNIKIISPMTGSRARMQATIIDKACGGAAPMFTNRSFGDASCGGQLGTPVENLVYSYTADQQSALDKYNYNPMVIDPIFGASCMVVGQKTCKVGEITDWSFIGHVSAFLNFQREVREQVMLPQIGKPNNSEYRSYRKQQVEHLLEKRLVGANKIWDSASVDTSTAPGVNDAAALNARKFIINVRVKVDVFSEEVILNFTNVSQDMGV